MVEHFSVHVKLDSIPSTNKKEKQTKTPKSKETKSIACLLGLEKSMLTRT